MEKIYLGLISAITLGLGVFFLTSDKDIEKNFESYAPTNIDITHITDDKINLHWQNHFIGKEIVVILENESGELIDSHVLEGNKNNIDLTLKNNKHYTFSVRAFRNDGEYVQSNKLYAKIISDYSKDHIFLGKDVELKFYKKSFLQGFKTLVYSKEQKEKSFIEINYIRDDIDLRDNITSLFSDKKNKSYIRDFIFPFGIKHTGEETYDFSKYMKVFYENKIFRDIPLRRNEKYYPVISKELTRGEYEDIYPTFFEIFSENFLNIPIVQNMRIRLYYKDNKKVPSYAELWKQEPYQKTMTFKQDLFVIDDYISRSEVSFRMPDELMNDNPFFEKKDKAIIFIHGLQLVRLDQDYNLSSEFPWRYNRRFDYFNGWFEYIFKNSQKFEDFDFYEFIYDTHSMTAEEFGEKLNEIMEENEFFKKNGYEEIYFVGHSMGGLVARYAANSEYRTNIENIITINAVNKGSPFQNLPQLFYSDLISNYTFSLDILEPLYNIITKSITSFREQKPMDIGNEIETIMRKNPLLFPVLLSEYGILDTFQGGMSINYANKEYLTTLENNLYSNIPFKDSIFKSNDKIENLNEKDKYLEKTVIFLSHINQFTSQPHFNFTYSVLKTFSGFAGIEEQDLSTSDGAVTLDSQMLEGYEGPTIDKTFYNNNVHSDILKNTDLIKRAFEQYILK
ncbi:MAG: alpha/beta fold hydrolase [Thermotogota bacterium]